MKKKINASLKLKIDIEAFKGDMTIGELALRYEVSPWSNSSLEAPAFGSWGRGCMQTSGA